MEISRTSRSSSPKSSLSPMSVEMHDAVNHIDMLMNRSGELTGLSTGYEKLDEMTGGLQGGDLFILAARPSMGKTAFALNVGRNMAIDHGKKVAIFSLEMTTRSLVMRMLSTDSRTTTKMLIVIAASRPTSNSFPDGVSASKTISCSFSRRDFTTGIVSGSMLGSCLAACFSCSP